MIEIEISELAADPWIDEHGFHQPKYHAQIRNEAWFWGNGRTPAEAIGSLVESHPKRFNFSIIYPLIKRG